MTQKRTWKMLAVVSLLALIASEAALADVTLTLEFTDLEPHVGQSLSLRVVDVSSLAEVARVIVPAVPSAAFGIDVSPFTDGHPYQIDYFLDQNANGAYDAPPVDAAWRFFISAIQGPAVIGVVHDAEFTNIDWPPLTDGVLEPGEYRHALTDSATGISVSWQNDASVLYVGLVSPGTGWLGIGFDPISRMQGANFILAAVIDGVLSIDDQFGAAQTVHRADAQSNLIQAAGREGGGSTVVEFAIPLASGDAEDKALAPGQTVTVLLAYNAEEDSFSARHTARSAIMVTLDGGI